MDNTQSEPSPTATPEPTPTDKEQEYQDKTARLIRYQQKIEDSLRSCVQDFNLDPDKKTCAIFFNRNAWKPSSVGYIDKGEPDEEDWAQVARTRQAFISNGLTVYTEGESTFTDIFYQINFNRPQ
jgi:hypothetical protein